MATWAASPRDDAFKLRNVAAFQCLLCQRNAVRQPPFLVHYDFGSGSQAGDSR